MEDHLRLRRARKEQHARIDVAVGELEAAELDVARHPQRLACVQAMLPDDRLYAPLDLVEEGVRCAQDARSIQSTVPCTWAAMCCSTYVHVHAARRVSSKAKRMPWRARALGCKP